VNVGIVGCGVISKHYAENAGAFDAFELVACADIDPAFYGQEAQPDTTDTVPERDAFEIAMARAAIERDMPLLGICRGMQLLNVACGGTLLQHLPQRFGHHEHRRVVGSFDGADHDVELAFAFEVAERGAADVTGRGVAHVVRLFRRHGHAPEFGVGFDREAGKQVAVAVPHVDVAVLAGRDEDRR